MLPSSKIKQFEMTDSQRRYDIDWLRVIAIGLLLVYHVAICFQPWGILIGFPVNEESWTGLWAPMSMLNVWRIPLLFFVSGMGVYFSLKNRNRMQLVKERVVRIMIPFLFGMFGIVPVHLYLLQHYYQWTPVYRPNAGHLWFLANIFVYVLLLLPLFYFLKKQEKSHWVQRFRKWLGHPLGMAAVLVCFVAEALLARPYTYALYAMTWHGFFLGLLAFGFGFCFVLGGTPFWNNLGKRRWFLLLAALLLYAWRMNQPQFWVPAWQLAIEAVFWIYSVFAFGYRYLNRQSSLLAYWSKAAYPVYIIHMIFLFLGAELLFPLPLDPRLKFLLLLLFTAVGSWGFYELVIKRFRLTRLLFGLGWKCN